MPGIALLLSLTTTISSLIHPAATIPPLKPVTFTPAEKTVQHQLGDKTISFKVIQYGESVSTCCINVHDNEATAVQAARAILEREGGLLIKIDNNAQRLVSFSFKGVVYTFDPNRIFSASGIRLTLTAKGKINPLAIIEVEKFAAHLLQLIPDTTSCIVALHNNTDGDYSVKSYQAGGKRQSDAKQVYADDWQDADDIALTTDENLFAKMSAMGYNSILQDNVKVDKDGSLSVYYGELNKRYINIETQFGKTVQYKEMLGKLLTILDKEKKPETTYVPMVDVDY
ncbi:hypothetical protein [Ferruginibacter sp. SUN106]|uniref:hypothetical protein n=1 Tax=Ferruginibacter sp. SUN106 TaxID=2978348 RepID=UPI003D360FB5